MSDQQTVTHTPTTDNTDTTTATSVTNTDEEQQQPNQDAHILENLIGKPNYAAEAHAIAEEMAREYSDESSYFDRFESLEYWDEDDEWYDQLADQYEVSFAVKGSMKAAAGKAGKAAGPKKGKAVAEQLRTDAIVAAGGVIAGKGRGREEVDVSAAVAAGEIQQPVGTSSAPACLNPPPAPAPGAIPKPIPPARPENSAHLFNPRLILQIVENLDRKYAQITKNQEYSKVVPTQIPASDLKALVAGYDHMFNTLNLPRYMVRKYGGRANSPIDLRFGDFVPSYFANVGGESMYQRKAYSIAGLRNLLKSGASIYSELAASHFFYPKAIHGALARMRDETGNVVDLDTVVLRVNSSTTVNMINASNKAKGLPTFNSTHEFGQSDQCKEIAINLASIALTEFQRAMRISDVQLRARSGHPSQIDAQKPVPIAYDNSTRGHVPLWRYTNAGQDSFHANCPEIEDVVGALLRAPLHCVYHYAFLFSGVYGPWGVGDAVETAADEAANNGISADDEDNTRRKKRNRNDDVMQYDFSSYVPKPLADKLDAFFEDCVADSCFNRKWKSIEEFGHMLSHEGTMTHVLQLLQMRHQTKFLEFYDFLDGQPSDDEGADSEGKEVAGVITEEVESTPAPVAAAGEETTTPASTDAVDATSNKPLTKNRVLVVNACPVPPPANASDDANPSSYPLNSNAIVDPPKRKKEIDFMWNLVVEEGGLRGKDPASGAERFISRGDVAGFVRATAGVV